MSRRIGVRLGALLLVVLATHAHAMVLCATRRGDVVADERCRKREVQLDAHDLGVIGSVGLPGPDGPAGPDGAPLERPFRVVDANGKTACVPVASDGVVLQCVLQSDPESSPFQLVLRRDGSDPETPYVYYGAPGCQGAPHTTAPAAVIARATALGTRLFVPSGPSIVLAVRSSERISDTCSGGTRTPDGTCCDDYDASFDRTVTSAQRIDLSTLGLTAPLHGEDR